MGTSSADRSRRQIHLRFYFIYFRFPAQHGRPSFSTPSGVGRGRIHGRLGNLGQCREMIIGILSCLISLLIPALPDFLFPLFPAAASSAATVTGYGDPLAFGLEVFWTSCSWHGRLGLPGIWPEIWRSEGLVGVRHCRCRGGPILTDSRPRDWQSPRGRERYAVVIAIAAIVMVIMIFPPLSPLTSSSRRSVGRVGGRRSARRETPSGEFPGFVMESVMVMTIMHYDS